MVGRSVTVPLEVHGSAPPWSRGVTGALPLFLLLSDIALFLRLFGGAAMSVCVYLSVSRFVPYVLFGRQSALRLPQVVLDIGQDGVPVCSGGFLIQYSLYLRRGASQRVARVSLPRGLALFAGHGRLREVPD